MVRKINRFTLLLVSCTISGAVIGGASNWIESQTCLQASTVTVECLTQDPTSKTIQGITIGLIAGAGAAIGATWQIRSSDKL